MVNEVAPGDNFIVGMWHNLPFDGKLERIARIVELIDRHGRVLIQGSRQVILPSGLTEGEPVFLLKPRQKGAAEGCLQLAITWSDVWHLTNSKLA